MSAPTSIRRAGYGTTTQARRPPDPYIITRINGNRWDVGCRSCHMIIAGIASPSAAYKWAKHHRCVYGGIGGEAT